MSSKLRKSLFANAKRILIKLGTSVVTQSDGSVALSRVANMVEQIVQILEHGKEVIIVTSGAVGMGKRQLRRQAYLSTPIRRHVGNTAPSDMDQPRACAAAGQSKLMTFYDLMFSQKHVECSQILLTDEDFSSEERRQNFRSAIDSLIKYGIIPIINENDVISTRKTPIRDNSDQIFWDNDSLSALISRETSVDICILLSDVEGLYTCHPDSDEAQIIHIYNPSMIHSYKIGEKSRVGRGGMQAKIDAAIDAVNNGVKAVVIASGYRPNAVLQILSGELVGTLFVKNGEMYLDENPTRTQATKAREASRKLLQLTPEERSKILLEIARRLIHHRDEIIQANTLDISIAETSKLSHSLLARLPISSKLETLAGGISSIANSEDPIGKIIRKTEVSEGLELKQITVPIGVLLIIFESRPDALPQIASLAIRSGNGLILKGGKEAIHTNKVLHKIITDAVFEASEGKVPKDLISFVETHQDVNNLLLLDKEIDLVIPRGSNKLVSFIKKHTKIPVLGHSEGICHVYIDAQANLESAIKIVVDAKTDYPSACNAVETILIHQNFIEDKRISEILSALTSAAVKLYGGPKACRALNLEPAPSLHHEYGDKQVTIEIVDNLEDAIRHINCHGSGHTEAIVTEDPISASVFLRDVDSACVFHNSSTRFADGYRFGLGAEVGISTGRIHARGPVGIDGLLTTKWILESKSSHVVGDFSNGKMKYTLKSLPLVSKL